MKRGKKNNAAQPHYKLPVRSSFADRTHFHSTARNRRCRRMRSAKAVEREAAYLLYEKRPRLASSLKVLPLHRTRPKCQERGHELIVAWFATLLLSPEAWDRLRTTTDREICLRFSNGHPSI